MKFVVCGQAFQQIILELDRFLILNYSDERICLFQSNTNTNIIAQSTFHLIRIQIYSIFRNKIFEYCNICKYSNILGYSNKIRILAIVFDKGFFDTFLLFLIHSCYNKLTKGTFIRYTY